MVFLYILSRSYKPCITRACCALESWGRNVWQTACVICCSFYFFWSHMPSKCVVPRKGKNEVRRFDSGLVEKKAYCALCWGRNKDIGDVLGRAQSSRWVQRLVGPTTTFMNFLFYFILILKSCIFYWLCIFFIPTLRYLRSWNSLKFCYKIVYYCGKWKEVDRKKFG